MTLLPQNLSCWVITDGHAAVERRCVGLAHALGLKAETKHISLRAPWNWFPSYTKFFRKFQFMHKGISILQPPFPDIVIASGRLSLPAVFFIKTMSPKTFVIQMNNPGVSAEHFDLVVAPGYENITGPNVINTFGLLNPYKPKEIAAAAAAQAHRLDGFNRPFVAAFVGGPNSVYKFAHSDITTIIDSMQQLLETTDATLIIFANNRTSQAFIDEAHNAFVGFAKRVWIWHGESSWTGPQNPFTALLGLADYFLVTDDSISMSCEAIMTGKPVFRLALEGGDKHYLNFHRQMQDRGITRPFDGTLANWEYAPIYEIEDVAQKVAAAYKGK